MKLLYFAAKTCTNWKRCTHTHTCTHMHTLTLKKGSLSSNRFILQTAETKPWKAKIEKHGKKKNQAKRRQLYFYTCVCQLNNTQVGAAQRLWTRDCRAACNKLPKIRSFSRITCPHEAKNQVPAWDQHSGSCSATFSTPPSLPLRRNQGLARRHQGERRLSVCANFTHKGPSNVPTERGRNVKLMMCNQGWVEVEGGGVSRIGCLNQMGRSVGMN